MRSNNGRRLQALLAVTVFAAVVTPVAIATAQTAETSASPAKQTAKQVKALKRQTAALLARVSSLEAALAGRPGAAAPAPTSLPPSGPAGGDLAATYPNPQIRADSIQSADIALGAIFTDDIRDGAVTGTDIADATIERVDLGARSVGSGQLSSTIVVKSGPNPVGPGQLAGNEATCPQGTRLVGGGGEWEIPQGTSPAQIILLRLFNSTPRTPVPGGNPDTWEVGGLNQSTATFVLFSKAICLLP